MSIDPLAGKPAPPTARVDVPRLVSAYYTDRPDPATAAQRVAFGTSGHRGTSTDLSFNDDHIAAVCQAVCDHRSATGITGPLYLGADTHALSTPAWCTAVEVLAANGVTVVVSRGRAPVPTPVISHAILTHNAKPGVAGGAQADGIVITPSHNPPADGGFKYNPPHGGPAGSDVTAAVERAANAYLEVGLAGVRRLSLRAALASDQVVERDLITPYVDDLGAALDLEAVAAAGLRIGADPLGGAALPYLGRIAERWGLDLSVVNDSLDPAFMFMTCDHDGKIRMDCSSPYAMAGLVRLAGDFDVAFGNDPDADRHGIVTPTSGLLNPNHYLSVAIEYLFEHRSGWPAGAAVGKTLVSSSMIDRVASSIGRRVVEVPVGFKWFVPGMHAGTLGFGGEESAGASFLRRDGTTWTTDKDGLLLGLLAAEIRAVTGKDPGELYGSQVERFGQSAYTRIDVPATAAEKAVLKGLGPADMKAGTLAGDPVEAVMTRASGNDEAIGGVKVTTANGWFAARPSGTEDLYKIYAESFAGEGHLAELVAEAKALVASAFAAQPQDAGAKGA